MENGIKEWPTSSNSTVTAGGARLAEHEVNSMKSNHEVDAPTLPNLTAVAASGG